MAITTKTRLGPYEIVAPLGHGGMGEVWRARDSRIGREIAIKVLPPDVSADPERLERFKREARTVGSLNHSNLLTLFDLGTHDDAPFMVTELLEGQTLRERIEQGRLPVSKVLDFGVQIARGLAAAHAQGIVHRDLKPENLFLMKDGRVKILDFGLAKETPSQGGTSRSGETRSMNLTESGMIVGTSAYMAPEQIRAERSVDTRADLFALGCVLYEMLSGRAAFEGRSFADTMSAVLNSEPVPLSSLRDDLPPGLDPLVRHCLEKDRAQRFQSAADVAFALENLPSSRSGIGPGPGPAPKRSVVTAGVAGALLAALLAGGWWWIHPTRATVPAYQRLTFQRGILNQARFSPDGQTVVYSAAWDGGPYRLYTTRLGSPESSALDLPSASLLAVGGNGMLAVVLRPEPRPPVMTTTGTLAQVSLSGGAPRELLENVQWADWGPEGRELAVIRDVPADARGSGGPTQELEMPVGRVLHTSGGWLSDVRVSPHGDQVAFLEHPSTSAEDRGFVMLATRAGKARRLTEEWGSIEGLAWSPDGREIWFSAAKSGYARDLWCVNASGRLRLIARMVGGATLHDVSRQGRVLFSRDVHRDQLLGATAARPHERDLSWLDWSDVASISAGGDTLLFSEQGEGAGSSYAVCMRRMDGTPVVRLGDGFATGLSPDGRWAVACSKVPSPHLSLLPTGPGTARSLDPGPIRIFGWASFSADGQSLVISGSEADQIPRTWVQRVEGGPPRPVSPPGIGSNWLTVDGHDTILGDSLYPVAGGRVRRAPGLQPGDIPANPASASHEVFVWRWGTVPVEIDRVDLVTGRRSLWRRIMPEDPVGLFGIGPVVVSSDGRSYAYTCGRILSDLYLAEGMR